MSNTTTQIPTRFTPESDRDRPSSSAPPVRHSASLSSAPLIRPLPSTSPPSLFSLFFLGHPTPLALLPGEGLVLATGIEDSWMVSLMHLPYIMTTVPTIRITDRRIIIQVKKKILGIMFYMKEESFNCNDLQQLSLRSSLDVPRVFFSVLLFSATAILEIIFQLPTFVLLTFFIVAALVLLAAGMNSVSSSTLNLDFYRKETVHSWLPFLGMGAGALRDGSSIRKRIELPTRECISCIRALYDHDKTQFAEDKRRNE